jgi:hypothetical protein
MLDLRTGKVCKTLIPKVSTSYMRWNVCKTLIPKVSTYLMHEMECMQKPSFLKQRHARP